MLDREVSGRRAIPPGQLDPVVDIAPGETLWFVVEIVEQLDLTRLSGQYRGSGSQAYHPGMLVALLIFGIVMIFVNIPNGSLIYSVLGLVTCEFIFRQYPEYEEGELTKIKSAVVSRRTCAEVSKETGLVDLVLARPMRSPSQPSVSGRMRKVTSAKGIAPRSSVPATSKFAPCRPGSIAA